MPINAKKQKAKKEKFIISRQNTLRLTLLFISVVFLFTYCSKTDKAKEDNILQPSMPKKAGIYKIELSPKGAVRNSHITVNVKGANPLAISYQWIANNSKIEGETGNVLKYPGLRKNDRVQVSVSIKDRGEFISEPLIIINSAPQIQSAKLSPQHPKKGTDIMVETKTHDEDGDSVSLTYSWFINGAQIPGETTDMLKGTAVKRGDKISVKITPSDGEQKGQAVTLYTIVSNSMPAVSSSINANIIGSAYTTKINAADPDDDTLTYDLRQAPKGMVIDKSTGMITWKVEGKDKGRHPVTASVTDGHGGELLINFDVTIGHEER